VLMARDCARGMAWLHESIPPIIHCDLKPGNLLVDSHYTVKICDFGLSCFKSASVLAASGGSLLWMAPELLSGKKISEKVDVYSFGIVLWEMVTREAPYRLHTSSTTLVPAVLGGERPPLSDKIHPSLCSLMQECWSEDRKKRPTFTSIIPRLHHILVDVTIRDPEGAAFWKYYFLGDIAIPWMPFVATFYQYLGEAIPNDRNESTKFNALEAILATQTADDGSKVVSLERFGQFLSWFGPLSRNAMYCPCFS